MPVREDSGDGTGSCWLLPAPHHPLTLLWGTQLQPGAPVAPVARQGPADTAHLQGVGCGWQEPTELILEGPGRQGPHLVGGGGVWLWAWIPMPFRASSTYPPLSHPHPRLLRLPSISPGPSCLLQAVAGSAAHTSVLCMHLASMTPSARVDNLVAVGLPQGWGPGPTVWGAPVSLKG